MKPIAAVLFSLALLYGGASWALGRCLSGEDRHEHASQEGESHSYATAAVNDSYDSFVPFFHCPTLDLRIEPAAQSSTARLKHTQRLSVNQPASLYEPDQTGLGHSRWLHAVFRPNLVFFQTGGLGRHLLFSILQI